MPTLGCWALSIKRRPWQRVCVLRLRSLLSLGLEEVLPRGLLLWTYALSGMLFSFNFCNKHSYCGVLFGGRWLLAHQTHHRSPEDEGTVELRVAECPSFRTQTLAEAKADTQDLAAGLRHPQLSEVVPGLCPSATHPTKSQRGRM